MSSTRNATLPAKNSLVLKKGKNGKYKLPLHELQNVIFALPPNLPQGVDVVFVQDNLGNVKVGVSTEEIPLDKIENVTNLYQVEKIARECEDNMARGQKVLTAQRILYDLTENEEKSEEKNDLPSDDFKVAAIDAAEVTNTVNNNRKIIDEVEVSSELDKSLKDFVVSEMNEITEIAYEWLKLKAQGKKTNPTIVSALKEAGISPWLYNRVCSKLQAFKSWTSFFFPKDMSKGFKITHKEFMRILGKGFEFIKPTQMVFDLVKDFGEKNDKRDDNDLSYYALPHGRLEDIVSRVKPPVLTTNSKSLQFALSLLYKAVRGVLPVNEESRDEAMHALFSIPNYDANSIKTPLQQLVEEKDQKFLFWDLANDGKLFDVLCRPYGCPLNFKQVLTYDKKWSYKFNPTIVRSWKLTVIGPKVNSKDPKFLAFAEILKRNGILQPKKKKDLEIIPKNYRPGTQTKGLLNMISAPKFLSVRNRIERLMNSFSVDDIRESAALALAIRLENMTVPKPLIFGFEIPEKDQDIPPDEEEDNEEQDEEPQLND